MIRIAIIGCGKIADEHAEAIQALQGCEVCAVCDREELMAWQMADRFRIKRHFDDASKMLREARPAVVHITTPPQGHHELGMLCLEHGCHVFIEKPFTINTREAEELIGEATARNLKLTVGHNNQFNPVAIRMRELIARGFLGGDMVHCESIFGYNLGEGQYARALLGDKSHWVRKLPGKLFQNVISHGISKIAEFIKSEHPRVIAHGAPSRALRALGETEIIDELRVIIEDEDGATGYFTFSSQIKPMRHEFRIFGPKNFIIADHTHQTLIKGLNKSYKSYLNSFVPPFRYGMQHLANAAGNVRRFLRNDFHGDYGRRRLLESFYRSTAEGTPLPITYKEILVTSRIMDAIVDQVFQKTRDDQSPVMKELTC